MRVVIGEDEALLREGLALVLERAGIEVVGSAADADEVVELVGRLRPDLLLTDIRMPPRHADDGLRAALRVRAAMPGTGVVVLSQYVAHRYARELLGTDAARVGYLLKYRIADSAGFCADLRRVAAGGTALDPEVASAMLSRSAPAIEALGPRRRQVLALIAEGRTNSGIARRLDITEKAVVAHTSGIYDALGLPVTDDDHRRVLAVVRYLTG
ncbi:response regulator transcription factor [Actinomycetospora soli]|uniref:response regulator transcription factor n=1 Tax=Actinomycetospora soli TaxID=2893887 RepID=UPI001E2C2AC3|nr:response regulator transcription factor [Actinomycetospora soli]MCD2190512.1 response regulator transcription factor [Actinomycetospora soli]